jgi:hypothetical protein
LAFHVSVNVLTGKLSIPKADEEFDKELDMGKIILNAINFNEVAYTEPFH